MQSARLGDVLVEEFGVNRQMLESALARGVSRLGDVLLSHGVVKSRTLADALARHHHLPRLDLAALSPDAALFTPRDLRHYLRLRYVPYRQSEGTITLATCEPSAELLAFARAYYGCDVTLAIISAWEWRNYLSTRGMTPMTRLACLGVRPRFRTLVADQVLVKPQRRGLLLLMLLITAAFIAAPILSWHATLIVANGFYLVSLLLRTQFYRHGMHAVAEESANRAALMRAAQALKENQLPIYTILVPLYQESADVMAQLIAHLRALEYPPERLDIKLICEADDTATIAALKSLAPPESMEILEVPPSRPRTKPKACNYALARARGDYLVIYDAEDAPEPLQLRMAVAAFAALPPEVACLQASLNYYNREDNLLTRCFAMEYSTLFRLLLPGLVRMGIPVPLGGTSNHLRMEALRTLGGWDAFNVTEDADLGIRLAYAGYQTHTLPSLTLEECPNSFMAWLKQRTRWVKGYIQTWLVYTRDLSALRARLGRTGYYGFHFFIGAPALTFLLSPILWGVFILSLMGWFPEALPPYLVAFCAVSFVAGTVLQWVYAAKVLKLEGWRSGYTLAFLVYPFYWLLHSLAAARALGQLITHPHYWEKTTHGVGRRITT